MQYLTIADLEARYPAELIRLAADENTGLRDDTRIEAAIAAATAEVRAVLKARYSADELDRPDADSLETLKVFTIDVALYRIAIAFSRLSEEIKDRYDATIKRLDAIAAGRGGLSFDGGSADPSDPDGAISPNEVIIDAPDRVFSRNRARGM